MAGVGAGRQAAGSERACLGPKPHRRALSAEGGPEWHHVMVGVTRIQVPSMIIHHTPAAWQYLNT